MVTRNNDKAAGDLPKNVVAVRQPCHWTASRTVTKGSPNTPWDIVKQQRKTREQFLAYYTSENEWPTYLNYDCCQNLLCPRAHSPRSLMRKMKRRSNPPPLARL